MASDEKVKELSQKLIDGVAQTFKSDNFKKYLKAASAFHDYSLRNTILILTQCEKATRVAGYEAWRKSGRYVKRGEKGIRIFVPSKVTVKKEKLVYGDDGKQKVLQNGEPLTEQTQQTLIKFGTAYVYDISQTDGERLICSDLKGDVANFEQIFGAIKNICPYEITFEQISNAKGYCNYDSKKIAINFGMSDRQTIKTLIHEITHAALHKESPKDCKQAEIEAESVAFIVSDFLGIDTSDYSFDYVAAWSKDLKPEQLKSVLENIQSTADSMISRIEKEMKLFEKVQSKDAEQHENLNERLTRAAEKANAIKNKKELISYERTPA